MSDKKNRGIQDYAMYDTMTTEELEDILRLDAQTPEEKESDVEKLLYIMEVLANRKNANNTGKTAQQAWESFQRNYLPEEEDGSADALQQKSGKPSMLWLRRIMAAAAILVLVVGIPVTVNAIGWENICRAFAKWSDGVFFFANDENEGTTPKDTDNWAYAPLRDMLEQDGIDGSLLPTWMPEGFALEKIEKDETPVQRIYRAVYLCGDKQLRIYVRSYLEGEPEKVEINDELLEVYKHSGIEYYIFSNMNQTRAVWSADSLQCNISGDLSVEEIETMIDSIGKG